MEIRDSFTDAVGNTPLIKLRRASEMTVLADSATRYQSKLFNPDFLREKGLPVPSWLG